MQESKSLLINKIMYNLCFSAVKLDTIKLATILLHQNLRRILL